MEKLKINRYRLSELVWRTIYENASSLSYTTRKELIEKSNALDQLRIEARYNTGSITPSSIWTLFAVVNYFRPKIVAEVGTFIGKSTFAMACAMDFCYSDGGEIYTCDFSNAIDLNFGTNTVVHQFQLKSSTEMFSVLKETGIQCDFLVLDGRLQGDDFQLIKSITHNETLILLDDFEGTEKGIINAIQLMENMHHSHLLIYPPAENQLGKSGMNAQCTLGMIIPISTLIYTNQ